MPVVMVTSAPGRTKRWPSLRRILLASGWKESLACKRLGDAAALRTGRDSEARATLVVRTGAFSTRLITTPVKTAVSPIASMTTVDLRLSNDAKLSRWRPLAFLGPTFLLILDLLSNNTPQLRRGIVYDFRHHFAVISVLVTMVRSNLH